MLHRRWPWGECGNLCLTVGPPRHKRKTTQVCRVISGHFELFTFWEYCRWSLLDGRPEHGTARHRDATVTGRHKTPPMLSLCFTPAATRTNSRAMSTRRPASKQLICRARFDRVYAPLRAHYAPLAGRSRAPSSRGASWPIYPPSVLK
jgi:hypothetical protein